MYLKSNTHSFSASTSHKEGEIDDDMEPPTLPEFDDSQRPMTPLNQKARKTKKSVFYADQSPYEMKIRLNIDENDQNLNDIKNRNSSILTPQMDLSLFDDLEGNNGDFNVKVYLRRRYAVVNQKNYFAPANKYNKLDDKFSEITENEIFFNVQNFFIFFFYHFFFHFILGPFTLLLTYHFTGSAIYRNQFFWGLNKVCFCNYTQYILYLSILIIYFTMKSELQNLNSFGIYMIIPIMFLRICIISIKYATMGREKVNIIKSRVVDEEELLQEFTFICWAWQSDMCIEKELQATIERTEIDLAMFKFSFLSDLDANLRKELEQTIMNETKRKQTSPSPHKKKSRLNIFEEKIYGYEHLFQNFFDSDLSGYALAKFLLKNIRSQTKRTFIWSLSISIPLSLIRCFLPIILEISSKGTVFTRLEVFLLILSSFLSLFYFMMNNMFLIYGIFELDKSYKILTQLSNLLSPKQIEEYHTTKTLPTINFFCPISLKCWDSLNRLFRNFGAKFRLRVNYYLSIFLIYIIAIIILILLSVFGVIDLNNRTVIIVFCFEVAVIFITLIITFLKALVINDHYHMHIFLIKKNKNILSDLLNLYGVYFEKEDYVPDNEVYKEGVFRIKSNVSALINYEKQMKGRRKNTEIKKNNIQKEEIIKKSLMNLINISDNIIEDLQFCAKYMPFKVLGISVNKQFVESVFAALGSVLIIIIQKILKERDIF